MRHVPIKGFEDKYIVREDGWIYSIPRYKVAGGWLKSEFNSKGYPRVSFYIKIGSGFKRVRRMVHLIVADAFLPPKPSGHEVNHIDGDVKNCHRRNLEWMTHSQNMLHGHRMKRMRRDINSR